VALRRRRQPGVVTADERRIPTHAGRAWAFADHLSASEILPVRCHEEAPAVAATHLFGDLDASFAARVEIGDLLVAGHQLGHGTGGAATARALHAGGFRAVVAASFAAGFADALLAAGLPSLEVDAPGIFHTGNVLRINYEAGTIANLSSGDRQPVRNLTDALLERLRDLIGR
jgi:3-isopropylmalate/(R)-2-methylmalate dehydratase small subunit